MHIFTLKDILNNFLSIKLLSLIRKLKIDILI